MYCMKHMHRTLLAAVALAVSSVTASAETITEPLGGDIQAAIDSAAAGDTIQLEAGTYEISQTLFVTVPLEIVGAGDVDPKAISVIDAGRRCRIILADADLEIRDLVLQNGMVGESSLGIIDPEMRVVSSAGGKRWRPMRRLEIKFEGAFA